MDVADPIVARAQSELPCSVERVAPRQALRQRERLLERDERRIQLALVVADLPELRERLRSSIELLVAELRLRNGREVVHRFLADFIEEIESADAGESVAQ